MQTDSQSLARISRVDAPHAHQVMNRWAIMLHSSKLVLMQTSWVWLVLSGVWLAGRSHEGVAQFGCGLFFMGIVALILQFCLVFIYPEWPVNRSLCQRLRRGILQRPDCPDWASDPATRVVELVPREHWQRRSLETATDLLMIHVDSKGVCLEGDCDRYELPADSIIAAELEKTKPLGWHTPTYMIVIIARTADGPIEIPLAYRDHGFGNLKNSRRQEHAIDLMHAINEVAKGQRWEGFQGAHPYAVTAILGIAQSSL